MNKQPPSISSKQFILQWHITHRCNLHCAHCYQDDCADQMSDSSLLQVLDKYVRFLNNNGYEGKIYLTGGEPLLHASFFKLLEEIKHRNIPFCILTNGTRIRQTTAHRLAQLQPLFVQISLDGTEKIHDKIRGDFSFQNALRGINELVDVDIPVAVSFTAQKTNIRCFSKLAKICAKHGVRKLWWDRVVTSDEKLALSTKEFKKICKTAARLQKHYNGKNGKLFVSCERSLQFLCGKGCYTCHAGKDMVTVLADGSVMPCRRLPFVIGSIFDEELDNILKSSELVQSLSCASVPAECADCKHSRQCRGGAKCVTYAQTGKLYSKDVNCFYQEKERKNPHA